MDEILKDALFLANVCDTLQISGYIKQELFDEHAALVENINETIARVFNYAAQQPLALDLALPPAKDDTYKIEWLDSETVRLTPSQ